MDAAQPQSPQRLGGYLLQQMGFCTFSTVIHDWKRGTLCVTGYQRFWCGVTQREDKVATKKKNKKNGQTGCTGTRVSNVLQCWTKNTKYAFVSDHIIHVGNNACISSFWEKQNLFSAFLGLFDITLLGIAVMLRYRRWGIFQIIYCVYIVLKTVFPTESNCISPAAGGGVINKSKLNL